MFENLSLSRPIITCWVYKRLQRDMVINVYLSSLIICDIQAELNFCDIEMGDVEKIKGCKGSCQVKYFMIIVLALTQQ